MENKGTAKKIIKCPHCGWEYEPAEILFPDKLLGGPTNVIRDALGHIIYTEYRPNRHGEGEDAPELTEEYYCDNCNKPFIVEVDISFKSGPQDEELDFSDTTVSLF